MSSSNILLQCVLIATLQVATARKQPIPYITSLVDTSKIQAGEDSGVPFDPYFTNGVQQVWHEDGTLLFEEPFGYQSRVYNVKMSLENHFRVGSNTKLFTAVSIYQLHERDLLNVNDNVTDYLNQSDFEKFGFPNQTKWCPQVHGGDGTCEPITFVQLMSMNSGMVDGVNCNYAPGSWELEYCQEYQAFQTYAGSMAAIVGGFINWPLSSPAGSGFHYTNENFMLLSYLVEKISGVSFREYLQTNILDVVGLKNTYYDPWQSSLGPLDASLGEGYRDYHDLSAAVPGSGSAQEVTESYYASSVCSDEFNTGAFCGTGGLVSSAGDMHTWYSNLFIDYNPNILTRASIDALIAPHTLTGATTEYESYFGQGVGTDVYIGGSRPFVIYYTGGMFCAQTSIRMLTATSTDPAIIAIAFRNNVIVDAPSGELEESLNSVTGTFLDIVYTDYEWNTFDDSRVIVADLASFFQANPNSISDSGSSDDDDSDKVIIAIVISSCIVAALVMSALWYLFMRQEEEKCKRSSGARSSLSAPILETQGAGDEF